MTRTSPPQVAFSSGEIDPLLHRRPDYQRFQTGLAKCRGFLPLPQGGFTRAPGTLHRGNTRTNAAGRLLPFVFAVNDAVVLEFTPLRMRVWRYGQLVMAGMVPYELVTPFDVPSLPRLQWEQSADVIYMCDGLQPIQRLSRFALDNWTIMPEVFTNGPFRVQNVDVAKTLQASGETGSINVTANAAFFVAGHIGSLIELRPTDNTGVPLWTSNEALTVGARRRYPPNVYQLTAGTNAGVNPPVHTEGVAAVDNTTRWQFISDDTGIAQITAITSPTVATATVIRRVPQACKDDPTYRWSEGAWSARYGYPSCLAIFDQRLVAAATITDPRTAWFSTVGAFSDFLSGIDADQSFAYDVPGGDSTNNILNLKKGRSGLSIFTLGEEFSSRGESRTQVIGPTTAVFSPNGTNGSSGARPIAPDGDPIFISRSRRQIVKISYSLERDSNDTMTLSRPSQHLGNAGFEEIVWQANPEPFAWIRSGAGELVAMLYDPREEVLGWATMPVAGGVVEALCVTPDLAGINDIVTMIVRRVVNGATVRFVEEMASIFGVLSGAEPITEACHFFAATEFTSGVATTTLSAPHLPGAQVHAWTNAGEYGPLTVAIDGTVTLPVAVTHAFVGLLDNTHFVETLDIQAAAQDGSTLGRSKRLHSKFGVAVHQTAQGFIEVIERSLEGGSIQNGRATLIPRRVAATLTAEPYSGVLAVPLPSGFATELALRFSPYSGAPMTITAIVPIVQEAGR